jgi:hypothetical protein
MGARSKLNAAYATGSLIVASLIGGITQSWPVFLIALGFLLVSNICMSEIRLQSRTRGQDSKRRPNHREGGEA